MWNTTFSKTYRLWEKSPLVDKSRICVNTTCFAIDGCRFTERIPLNGNSATCAHSSMTSWEGYKMAAVGSVQGEKCVEESDESADCVWPPLTDRCRKNGFSNDCRCSESSCAPGSSELTKYNCIVKINGLKALTKQTAASSSLHLRPRAYRSQRIAAHYFKRHAGCQLRLATHCPAPSVIVFSFSGRD